MVREKLSEEERARRRAIRAAKYYAKNREKIRTQQKINHEKNKKKRNEKDREYYREHREDILARRRNHYALTRR